MSKHLPTCTNSSALEPVLQTDINRVRITGQPITRIDIDPEIASLQLGVDLAQKSGIQFFALNDGLIKQLNQLKAIRDLLTPGEYQAARNELRRQLGLGIEPEPQELSELRKRSIHLLTAALRPGSLLIPHRVHLRSDVMALRPR